MNLKSLLEALLFASRETLTLKEVQKILKETAKLENSEVTKQFESCEGKELQQALCSLQDELKNSDRGYLLEEVAGGYRLISKPDYAPWIRQHCEPNRAYRLSLAALETLAIVAYRQPVSRAEIESVRGVASDAVVNNLLEKGLIQIAGRAEVPGRPLLYQTSDFFLECFGLRHLSELPNAEELKRTLLEKTLSSSPENKIENILPLSNEFETLKTAD